MHPMTKFNLVLLSLISSYVGYQYLIFNNTIVPAEYNIQPNYESHIAVIESSTNMILHGNKLQGCSNLQYEKHKLEQPDMLALSPAVPKLEVIIQKYCIGAPLWD